MARFSGMQVTLAVLVLTIVVLMGLLIAPRINPPDRSDVFLPQEQHLEPVRSSSETILVRGDWSYPPFEFINEQGKPDGFNIEIIRRISELMNLDLQISLGPWETVRQQLERGEIDVLAGMYRTDEREKLIDFTIPHFISSYGVFVPKNSGIDSLDDIRDSRILVQEQDVGHDYLVEQGIGKEIVTLKSWIELLPELQRGRGDCAVLAMMQGVRQLQEENISDLRVISKPLFQRRYCIAVKSGDAELLATLNEGLNMLKSTGEYDLIFERWFGIYSEPGLSPQNLLASRWVRIFIAIFLIVAVLLLIFLVWTYSLRRQVGKKTAELSSALENLQQANSAKNRFLASVSHELRTPLHGVIGMVRMLDASKLDQEQREIVEMLSRSAVQLHRVLSDLIDATRLEAGRFTLHPSHFRLKQIGTWLEPLLRRSAEEKGLQFDFQVANDVVLCADQERLIQIIVNLAENAIKNTPFGFVKVRIEYSDEQLQIEVEDNGRGIPNSQREAIFAPFTQLEAQDKISAGKEAGLGLGLAIVKTIIDLMEGEIKLDSRPEEGTTFFIHIPIETGTLPDETCPAQTKEPAPRGPVTEEPAAGRNVEQLHILVAEDEAINRIYLERFLQSRGWKTTPVSDGELALKALQQGSYDVVLMDLGMPKLDGLEVTQRLREFERDRNVPYTKVIALTAYADDDNRRKCSEAGMDGFVTKPFKEQELVDEILRLV
ncbi:MAG: transporter substrate-binding domain-containing protein [Spirochaetota bacterium]